MPRVSWSAVDLAADSLRALVRIPTVSSRDPAAVDTDAFDRFLAELARRFPLLHERPVANQYVGIALVVAGLLVLGLA